MAAVMARSTVVAAARVGPAAARQASAMTPRPQRPAALKLAAVPQKLSIKSKSVQGLSMGMTAKRTLCVRASAVKTVKVGDEGTIEFRIFYKDTEGKEISPWHDIPLKAEGKENVFNFIVEIPKETAAKMETATKEDKNPIKQDIKKEKIRFYPYNINWNYGMIPQTWEDPTKGREDIPEVTGDNDPIDVVEIGSRQAIMGEVLQVKPLGIYGMIDEGELDWKVVAIDINDEKAALVNDLEDVEKHFPGTLEAIMVWFRDYKMPDGKPANVFAYDFKPKGKDFALEVIEETHKHWKELVEGKTDAGKLVVPQPASA